MNLIKQRTFIIMIVFIVFVISGIFICRQAIDTITKNITTDYPTVYKDDLDRLLGEGWTVVGKELGYMAMFDITNIYTWELEYNDISGERQSIIISNFKDRSMSAPLGYCIEKYFEFMVGQRYVEDVIAPIIPAIFLEPKDWYRNNYHTSGDHITDRPYPVDPVDANPRAKVSIHTESTYGESSFSKDWENPQSLLNLYSIDYASVFQERSDQWYLSVCIDFTFEELSKQEYENSIQGMEEIATQILEKLNAYTGNTVKLELIFPTGSQEPGSKYKHWYVADGKIVEEITSDWGSDSERQNAFRFFASPTVQVR